jgi:tetratricopeptide (TPR) repeat protein
MVAALLLYNQSTSSDEDFIANFVARHDVLETLMRRLRTQDQHPEGSHQILVGPRGMGKSSLLRRLAIAVHADEQLKSRYIPLTFREEQYNVLSVGDFWRNCGESLAEWAEKTGQDMLAKRLDAALASAAWAGDDAPAEQFLAAVKQLDRRALLLVDNIDLILDAVPDDAHWSLRRHLQQWGGPIMIGAATHPLRQSADREAAFYEFFQPHHLEPLDERQTEQCMRALAMQRGEHGKPVIRVLNTQPERLKTLHALTGGNPRVLTLIYRLLETTESDAAMADLEILLDQVTPYYKARTEEYQTPLQRAVIDAIALHWDPITAAELSRLTNIAATTLPNLLTKLRKDGLIEVTEISGAATGHQIAERFLNIWYLMRHGTRRTKHKMRWLVGFLTIFYSSNELADIAARVRSPADRGRCHPDYAYAVGEAVRVALGEVDRVKGMSADEQKRMDTEKFIHHFSNILSCIKAEDRTGIITACDDTIAHFRDTEVLVWRTLVAVSQMIRGDSLSEMGDSTAAIAAYDDVVARFGDAEEPALREQAARALVRKGDVLSEMSDSTAAIATYDNVVARFGDAVEPALREQVAQALANKGDVLSEMSDSVAAVTTYDDVVARFGDAVEPALREQVANALVNKGFTLGQLGDSAAAAAAYDDVVARFGDAVEPALREQVARALVNKGDVLSAMGDNAAAVVAYDDVLGRFDDAVEPALREQVAIALVNKGVTSGRLGDSAAAIAAYNDVVARFGDADEPEYREQVATALTIMGLVLRQIGDNAAAIATCNDVIARFGDAQEPVMRKRVGVALVNKGIILRQMGDSEAAIAAYDDVVARFGDAVEPALRNQVARARISLANLLVDDRDDLAGAEALYNAAATTLPLLANGNLAWLCLLDDRLPDAQTLRETLGDLRPHGRSLLDAAIELARDNFGLAMDHLGAVLTGGLETGSFDFTIGLYRLVRLAERKGYGERLVGWLEETGLADQLAPLYVAVKAYVRGEQVLLDVNPEVRGPARIIHDRLAAARRYKQQAVQPTGKAGQRRGRPRKA